MDSAFLFDTYIQSCKLYHESQNRVKGIRERPSPLLVDLLSKERVGTQTDHSQRFAERGAEAGENEAKADKGIFL